MISHKHKFVLITPPRTASNTIRKDLENVLGEHLGNHKSIEEYLLKFPDLSDYKFYGSVRDPWSRLLSYWCFFLKQDISFKQFITNQRNIDKLYVDILDLFSIDNTLIVLKYINFNNLQKDFDAFCKDVGILPFKLSIDNKGSGGNCSLEINNYYSEELYDIVKKEYKKEIEHFRYD